VERRCRLPRFTAMTDPSSTHALQFGRAEAGRAYRDRPAAFGIAVDNDGRVAVVHIIRPEQAYYDLPGGAVDGDETEPEALVREFGEETGLIVRVGMLLTRSSQYLLTTAGEAANNRAGHYRVDMTGQDESLKIEADHTLVWLDPHEALQRLRHDSHAWALATWLRAVPL
jgi:8-oxo-dGTP diphosphatase